MKVSFEIPSSVSVLPHLRQALESVLLCGNGDAALFSRETVKNVVLILNEAVTNAIIHAHKRRSSLPVEVRIALSDGVFKLAVGDHGAGFDIDSISEPAIDAVHGRGIFIIRRLAESVSYKNNTLLVSYRINNEDKK